jgi:DNA-binding transcriptional LysR family regulator
VLPLFDERFVVLTSKDHQLAGQSVVMGMDLHQQSYVNRASCEFRDHIREQFLERGIMTRRVFRSESDDWVKAMIKAGLGFGLFPEYSTSDRDLIARPLVDPDFVRRISLLTVRGRPHCPSVGAFVAATKAFKWPGLADERQRAGWSDRARAWLNLAPSAVRVP